MNEPLHDAETGWVVRGANIAQAFGNHEVLSSADIEVAPSEIVAVAGASGSGKSTLLHVLSGLRRPTSGAVWWRTDPDGSAIEVTLLGEPALTVARRRLCSVVYQFSAFVEDLSVRENVALPMVLAGQKHGSALAEADAFLATLGMGSFLDASTSDLSGGERQRVAVARALATKPRVIFADEPTGSLDEANSDIVVDLFVQLAQQFKTAVVVATHDSYVMERASRVVWLRNGLLRTAA